MADDPKKPYGKDANYADPGYQSDGVARYPCDSEAHVRAAWSYISMPKNAAKYTAKQLSNIKSKIRAAARKFGIEIEAASAAPPKGGAVMASLQEQLAQRLGLEPDADDAAVLKAFDDKFAPTEEEAPEEAEEPKTPEPVVASAPNVVQLQKDQYEMLMAAAAQVTEIRAERAREDREKLVMAAIGDGRITPASKADWLKALEVDPGGHNKTALASLAPGLVPVSEIGHAIASEATDSEQADKERMLALITGRKDA